MVVITLTNCPPALRGDLTLWLMEIDTGVFVGRVSARVREQLWQRVVENARDGRAVMVHTARNEQGLDFRVHAGPWAPIDFDGLKLMMRPSPTARNTSAGQPQKPGFSTAARVQQAKRMVGGKRKYALPDHFVVIDLETTGLSALKDAIIELAAIRCKAGKPPERFQMLARTSQGIPPPIQALTGITQEMLDTQGQPLDRAMNDFLSFVGGAHVVSHQSSFDYSFLQSACRQLNLTPFSNPCTDTLSLARRLIKDVRDYRLSTLAAHLEIRTEVFHRGMADCETTLQLFHKLIEIGNQPK